MYTFVKFPHALSVIYIRRTNLNSLCIVSRRLKTPKYIKHIYRSLSSLPNRPDFEISCCNLWMNNSRGCAGAFLRNSYQLR
ncbi:hypothetical protein L6452_16298 [Arctium lappa]|uniref:Uncharacterized protein n=1 Tax=Arctium lappa TaxID=4217 RepID=A0ACB9C0D7_ARCLA|nr:hypothetical protein L6452_16298 [Arctium lappa]